MAPSVEGAGGRARSVGSAGGSQSSDPAGDVDGSEGATSGRGAADYLTDVVGSEARQAAEGLADMVGAVGNEAKQNVAATVAVVGRALAEPPDAGAEGGRVGEEVRRRRSLSETIAEAGVSDVRRAARKVLSGEVNLYDEVCRAGEGGGELGEFGRRAIAEGSRWARDSRAALREGLSSAESLLEAPGRLDKRAGDILQVGLPSGLRQARWLTLKLAQAGKEGVEVAESYAEQAGELRKLARAGDPVWLQRKIGELEKGDSYAVELRGELDLKEGLGVQVDAGARMSTTRTNRGYELSIKADGAAGPGAGAQAQEEGAGVDSALHGGGEFAVHCTGPDAGRRVAELMAVAQGDIGGLRALADSEGVEVRRASGRFGVAVGAEMGAGIGLSGAFQGASTKAFERIGGEMYRGWSLSTRLSGELSSSVQVQVRDGVAEFLPEQADEATDFASKASPLAREAIERMPPEAVEAINEVYGPVGGLKFGGEVNGKVEVMDPVYPEGSVRLEASLAAKGTAGRTDVTVATSLNISDAEALARATGIELAVLADRLRQGEVTIAQLRQLVSENGGQPSEYLEVKTDVKMARANANRAEISGLSLSEETVDRETLYSRRWLGEQSGGGLRQSGKQALDKFAGADGVSPLAEEVRDRRLRRRLK